MDQNSSEKTYLKQMFNQSARDPWQWFLTAKNLGAIAEDTFSSIGAKQPSLSQVFTIGI